MEARLQRQQAMTETRRALVLDAARAVFQEHGLDGASMREIARRAGYTPGALYSYFDSKEAIYGALLAESLERLNAAVAAAGAGQSAPALLLRLKSRAWFDFYATHPRELDLGFYLVHGLAPRGLNNELDTHLNQRLGDALAPAAEALTSLGLEPAAALRENTALFAHGLGLLLLQHTGRIRMFAQDPAALFDSYLDSLLARALPTGKRKTHAA